MAELSSALLTDLETPSSTKQSSFFSRFSLKHYNKKQQVQYKVTEAAASLSAGLHHRNFHRRRQPGSETSTSLNNYSCCCGCTRSCVERLIHKGWWRSLYMFIIVTNLCLALIEPTSVRTSSDGNIGTSNYPGEQNAILLLEIIFVSFYGFDVWLRWFAGEDVVRDVWLRIRCAAILCIFINVLSCFISNLSDDIDNLKNFSRLLRPVLFIERFRNVRKIAASTISTLPKVTQILLLLAFWILFFGVAGFTLFAGVVGPSDADVANNFTSQGCSFLSGGIAYVENIPKKLALKNQTFFACSTFSKISPDGTPCLNYFETIWTSMMHLFILLTTANYPDIMLPAYNCSQWASIFFIVFITVGLYFLLSLILAVVYTHFAARNVLVSTRNQKKKIQALKHAFSLMTELSSDAENDEEGGDGGDSNEEKEEDGKRSSNSTEAGEIKNVDVMDAMDVMDGVDPEEDDFDVSRTISRQVWINVVHEYRPQLPIHIVEALFVMCDRNQTDQMTWEQYKLAVEHTRLKVTLKKKAEDEVNTKSHLRRSVGQIITDVSNYRRCLRVMLRHRFYEFFMDGLIIINTLFMLVRLTPNLLSNKTSSTIKWMMVMLLFVFTIEIIIKCYALTPKIFWRISHFNKIDVISILGGLISFIIETTQETQGGKEEEESFALSDIFLLVRIIRMLRILRMNDAFRIISATIVEIAPALLRYIGVLFALFYAFGVLGMELFAGLLSRQCLQPPNNIYETWNECEARVLRLEQSSYGINDYWSNNFNTLPRALVVLYEQMVVNNWVIVMEGCVAAHGNEWSRVYFISFWICCVGKYMIYEKVDDCGCCHGD